MSADIIQFPPIPTAEDALSALADRLGWPLADPAFLDSLGRPHANEDEALRDELILVQEQLKALQERRDELIGMLAKRERAP